MGEGVSLVREPDAGDLHVRFDERRLETERMTRTEAPALPANSYSPRHAGTAPVVDSTRSRRPLRLLLAGWGTGKADIARPISQL